jgi:hypothetical protein
LDDLCLATGLEVVCIKKRTLGQGHLVEGEDSDTFFSLLWSEIYNLNMVGARVNLTACKVGRLKIMEVYFINFSQNMTPKGAISQKAYVLGPE